MSKRALEIVKEEKRDVDAQKRPNTSKKGGPLMRGNLGRFGTVMQKPPRRKKRQQKRFTSK